MAKKNEPIGKMTRVSPNDPKYEGVSYRLRQGGHKTFYINYRNNGKAKWEKLGRDDHGFTAAKAKKLRIQRIQQEEIYKGILSGEFAPKEKEKADPIEVADKNKEPIYSEKEFNIGDVRAEIA